MVMREIYSTGLKRKVECEVSDIIATKTKGGGSRYQVIGFHTNPETGKEHKCQSMIGAQEAAQICEQLGKTLPVYAAEEVAPAAFAAEASEPADGSALSRLKKAIASDSPEEVAIPMEAGKADQEALDEAVEDMDAEFDEVIESVNNTFEDSDGREVFVVDTPIKNYLEEVMADDMRDGFVSISKGSNADEWEIAFPYEFAEDVIDAIVEFQEMDDPVAMDFYMNRPEVEADIYAARGVDSLNEVPEKFSKATIAMITAAIGLAGVWAWSNSKK